MLTLRNIRHLWKSRLRIDAARAASNFKRPPLHASSQFDELRATLLADRRPSLSQEEWQEVRQGLCDKFKHINSTNIDAVILGMCSEGRHLSLAQDYVAFLRRQGMQPNLASLGKLLRIYNAEYHWRGADGLTGQEQQDVLAICRKLRGEHDLLDATSCENLIHGLVATEEWRRGEELLQMMRVTATPSLSAYTEMAVKAFREGDSALGWQLLEQMVRDKKQPKCEVFAEYLRLIDRPGSVAVCQDLEVLLQFLETHALVISEKVVQAIQGLAARHPATFKVQTSSLNRVGKCAACKSYMQIVETSDEEFARLCDSFLNKVLIRQDVFQKSSPEEVDRFKEYVERSAPYDCVIDGLNVAYSSGVKKQPQVFANLLATVVKHFQVRQKHVLVLGRKHMNSWPKDSMNYVRKHASVFLTNNLTHDDPFLLYATLKSGPRTDFFSRDLMRSHAYLLGPELRGIFRRWQQEHQYSLITKKDDGKLIVKEPIRHLIHAHKVQSTWHLPYVPEYQINPSDIYEVPDKWLCIQLTK